MQFCEHSVSCGALSEPACGRVCGSSWQQAAQQNQKINVSVLKYKMCFQHENHGVICISTLQFFAPWNGDSFYDIDDPDDDHGNR